MMRTVPRSQRSRRNHPACERGRAGCPSPLPVCVGYARMRRPLYHSQISIRGPGSSAREQRAETGAVAGCQTLSVKGYAASSENSKLSPIPTYIRTRKAWPLRIVASIAYPLSSAMISSWRDRAFRGRSSSSSADFLTTQRVVPTCLSLDGRTPFAAPPVGPTRRPSCPGGCSGNAWPAGTRCPSRPAPFCIRPGLLSTSGFGLLT